MFVLFDILNNYYIILQMDFSKKNTLYKLIGEKIKFFRQQKKLSQSELAEKLSLSRTSIVNIEQGRQHPYIHILWEIADIINIPINDLIPQKEDLSYNINFETIEEKAGNKDSAEQISKFLGETLKMKVK